MPNAGDDDYYRAHYEPAALKALTAVGDKRLTVPGRLSLASDVGAGAQRGELPIPTALALAASLAGDSSASPRATPVPSASRPRARSRQWLLQLPRSGRAHRTRSQALETPDVSSFAPIAGPAGQKNCAVFATPPVFTGHG
jgi:hypothetical protein